MPTHNSIACNGKRRRITAIPDDEVLEVMAEHIFAHFQESPKRLFAIANNACSEAHHNAVALGICRQFAAATGMTWSGGLALGAGALLNGQPIEEAQRKRLPVKHISQAQ